MTPTHPAASMPASGRVPRCSCIMGLSSGFSLLLPGARMWAHPVLFFSFHPQPPTNTEAGRGADRVMRAPTAAGSTRRVPGALRHCAQVVMACARARGRAAGGGRRGARGAATGVRHAQKRENTSLFNARVLCDAALTLRHDASLFGMTLLCSVLSSVHHPACSRVVRFVLLTLRDGAPAAAPGRRMAAHTHGQPRGLGLGGARGGLAAARSIAAGRSALCAEPAA